MTLVIKESNFSLTEHDYGSHLSHIFEKPGISIEKLGVSIEKPSIWIVFLFENYFFNRETKFFKSKKQVFQIEEHRLFLVTKQDFSTSR